MLCLEWFLRKVPSPEQLQVETHNGGELRSDHAGKQVTLAGWVHQRRDHGGSFSIDVRDRWRITQIVVDQQHHPNADSAQSDDRLQVIEEVRKRRTGAESPDLPTGTIEVVGRGASKNPHFSPLPRQQREGGVRGNP